MHQNRLYCMLPYVVLEIASSAGLFIIQILGVRHFRNIYMSTADCLFHIKCTSWKCIYMSTAGNVSFVKTCLQQWIIKITMKSVAWFNWKFYFIQKHFDSITLTKIALQCAFFAMLMVTNAQLYWNWIIKDNYISRLHESLWAIKWEEKYGIT